MKGNLLVSIILILAGSISGCGGSDDSSSPPPPAAATSAEGRWMGSSSTGRSVTGVVLEDGTYWFLYSQVGSSPIIAGVVQGSGSSQNGSFTSSTGTDFDFEETEIIDVSVTSSYVMKQTINGTVTYANNHGQTTFTSNYDDDYDLTPDVNLLIGTYSGSVTTAGAPDALTVTVSAPNSITGTSISGCNFSGSVSPRSQGNVYDISVTFEGGVCSNGTSTVNGVAFFDAATKTLRSAALNSARTKGFVYVGTKP
ncbi:MAG: hypothetical protein L0H94_13260 [Nitrospira sp.]|nr:hypothetical protein [Nitrospira sp.]